MTANQEGERACASPLCLSHTFTLTQLPLPCAFLPQVGTAVPRRSYLSPFHTSPRGEDKWSQLRPDCHPSACMRAQLLSHAQLFATPWVVALQAPLSMGFSRQEYWSGLPFPPPGNLPNPRIKPTFPALQAVLNWLLNTILVLWGSGKSLTMVCNFEHDQGV